MAGEATMKCMWILAHVQHPLVPFQKSVKRFIHGQIRQGLQVILNIVWLQVLILNQRLAKPIIQQANDENYYVTGMKERSAVTMEEPMEKLNSKGAKNLQLFTMYINGDYNHLKSVENAQSITVQYLAGQSKSLPKMCSVPKDWLVRVYPQFYL